MTLHIARPPIFVRAALLLGLLVAPAVGLLQATVVQAQPDARSQARAHAQGARQLYEAGDYRGAIAGYQRAEAADPSGYNDFNIGLCYDKLGEADPAVRHYRSFLARVPDAANRSQVEASVVRLENAATGAARKAEEARRAEEARQAELARQADASHQAEEARRAAEAQEAARVAAAAEAARLAGTQPVVGGPPSPPARAARTGDPELDRVAAVDIASVRTQMGIAPTAAAMPPPGPPALAGGVTPAPAGQPIAPAPAEPAPSKPFYKQWWFWVVAGVSAYVLLSIAADDSSDNQFRAQQSPPMPSAGATLLTF